MTQPPDSLNSPPVDQTFDPLEVEGLPRTTWPMVVGIIGVILASMGMLGSFCGLLYPALWSLFVDWMRDVAPKEQVDLMIASQPPTVWVLGSSVIGLLLAAILLTGSIRLIKRRRSAVTWLLAWAVVNIPWTVIGVIMGILLQSELVEQAEQAAGTSAAGQQVGMYLGSCIGLVFGLTFPVFLLAWLSRTAIRDEVAAWSERSIDFGSGRI